ncbi:sulfite reductase subunit alpha [Hylemonella sp. W303a]|uniref:sulfite reductase subunit alpha n=1 Tax=Hylemonella sp. W303a TaxID=3389873 RepID=UPI00396B3386
MKFVQALLVLLVYAAFCTLIFWRHRQRVRAAAQRAQALLHSAVPGSSAGGTPWWVVHASQTGQAEALAEQTAQALHSAGLAVRLLPLGQLRREALQGVERLLCIVSTYGEGDAPDSAAAFVRDLMEAPGQTDAQRAEAPRLEALKFGVLALGDVSYAQYCGFGRALDAWLQDCGAQPLFDRIEADRMAPSALLRWREQLGALIGAHGMAGVSGGVDLPDWETPPLQGWTLRARRHLNPGSAGGPVHHLEFVPEQGALPSWEAGDLAQIEVPGAAGVPRDYSIASIPADGALHLLVRQTRRTQADGSSSPGLASGWLTAATEQGLPVGGRAMLRVRSHSAFRIGANASRPLILIGNGTGLAGLRAHIRARLVQAPQPADGAGPRLWLFFGERHAATDAYYRDELQTWVEQGVLRVEWVFSREPAAPAAASMVGQAGLVGQRRYVQHALRDAAPELRDWVSGVCGQPGAAIYVCGSLQGMAGEVDAALRDILGETDLRQLADEGRYRRDVY